MNVLDELRNLDANDVGRWPLPFRVAAIAIVFLAVSIFGIYMTVVKNKVPVLERVEAQEQELRATFENKQRKAANFDAYKEQLEQMRQSFGTMLRQLPGETEIPNLIVDISQTGLAAGLEEKLFEPQAEVPRDFYAEKPIKIELEGGYHELANFASSVAALPRIVTLHDVRIQPAGGDRRGQETRYDQLSLAVTAKTYRYMDQEDAE